VRTAVQEQNRPVAKPAGSAVASAAVLLLILAPALAVIAGADALTQGPEGTRRQARADLGLLAAVTTARAGELGAFAPGTAEVSKAHAAAAGGRPLRLRQLSDRGLRLLRESADAGRTISYQGVQVVSWWSAKGTTTIVVHVVHQPGRGTLLRTADTGAGAASESFVADDPGAQSSDVLGVTEETPGLLADNYYVVASGTGSASGRTAAIVEAHRDNGTLAARFWLDAATKIPLRRELFDGQSRMINESSFIDLDLNRRAVAVSMALLRTGSFRPWNALTPADLGVLRAEGWPLPSHLPDGLTLFSARQATTRSGLVLELGYSDGLSGLSLFVQRGGLSGPLPGWREVKAGGWPVYARDPMGQGLTWSSHGHVLTVIADAGTLTISAVVKALPHDAEPGFWARLRYGFRRVVSWVNPFG